MRYPTICAAVLGIATLTASNLRAAGPATQPVAAAQVCDVYLTPFTALSNDNTLDWMGKAVEQNLLTDLARAKLHPLAADKPLANTADAQAAAKAAGAKYLIAGSYQVADQQVRFNAQLIDAGTGNVLGGISTTGAVRDLFTMEDALSSQALQQLGQLPGLAVANNKPVAPAPAAPAAAPVAAAQPPVVVQIIQAPPAPAPISGIGPGAVCQLQPQSISRLQPAGAGFAAE
jgi:TolB-like protein